MQLTDVQLADGPFAHVVMGTHFFVRGAQLHLNDLVPLPLSDADGRHVVEVEFRHLAHAPDCIWQLHAFKVTQNLVNPIVLSLLA